VDRHLATIQQISRLTSIPDADNIEIAHILGWEVVVKKHEFKAGDLIIYAEIDSVLPEHPEFEFLRKKSSWVDNGLVKGFRIKTIRLRKQLSQGIVFPITILKQFTAPLFDDLRSLDAMLWKQVLSGTRIESNFIGTDVTASMGIVKYEYPIPAQLAGKIKRDFPQHLMPKTDETRIQSIPHILTENAGTRVYVTEKLDGTSCTFYYEKATDTFGVCSRNLELKLEDEENEYVKMAKFLNLEEQMRNFGQSVCIQGEIVGPGIQHNKYKRTQSEFYVFNIYMIDSKQYLGYYSVLGFLSHFPNLKMVPVLALSTLDHTVEQLLALAEGDSMLYSEQTREGVVIRPLFEDVNNTPNTKGEKLGRLSFKVISNKFLENDEE